MANYMAEVANMLGVDLLQDFECNESSCTYRITERGLTCNGCYGADSLVYILNGTFTIKRGPWKPHDDDLVFIVGCDGEVMAKYWDNDSTIHKTYYRIGNCYETKEDAEADRDKWIAFYASNEVLEV